MRVAASWSGGKESCLACYKAISDGFVVSHLLNFISKDGRCMSHGVDYKLISAQSQAIEIPVVQREITWDLYEREFKIAVRELRQKGLEGIVFGDIQDIPQHEGWVDRVCSETDIKPVKPLWGRDPKQILTEFICKGFKAIVVKVKADLLGEEWLGREVDRSFVIDLLELEGRVHPCGEFGEYHTYVYDGPLFKRSIKIFDGEKVLKNGYWFLDVSKYQLFEKT